MNLSASFVALSACNTANFDLDAMAQDLPALASAFAVSGVPNAALPDGRGGVLLGGALGGQAAPFQLAP